MLMIIIKAISIASSSLWSSEIELGLQIHFITAIYAILYLLYFFHELGGNTLNNRNGNLVMRLVISTQNLVDLIWSILLFMMSICFEHELQSY